ncbi:hypothetical protein COO60DRAFT_970657 [Scenedesmus sp. NREL 46B-D3]|nr:hypothetical protein COO60DRAFT_970657 [Scenedesmus sp. NREL 46B-D3]
MSKSKVASTRPERASCGSGSTAAGARLASPDNKPDAASTNATAANGLPLGQECGFCHKVPDKLELLLRCSRCKHAWYCSQACQRSAWPQHKQECKKLQNLQNGAAARSGTNSCSSSAATSPTAQQAGRAEQPDTAAAADAGSNSRRSPDRQGAAAATAEQRASDNANMLDVLKNYLQQHSAAQSDPLQQQFEQAVLLYVRQEHRTALAQLQAVQRAAEQQGQLALAGDACRWMGHAYSKLGDAAKAAGSFANGCQLAEKSGNKKLQVDCLSGMGAMHRDNGQLRAAEGFMRQALRCAEALGDDVVRASCLTHLGSVLVASDAGAAIKHLEEAVQLREDQVILLHDEGKRGSSLATAIMEHAGSLVSLAGAYYCSQRYVDAGDAYSKSLAVFEMIDDTDKVVKCLINLANLYELQIQHPAARGTAAEQRQRLYALSVQQQLGRAVPETCSICCEPISPLSPTTDEDQKLLLLGCLHCFHHKCWESWSEKQSTCPSCKQPMPLTTHR